MSCSGVGCIGRRRSGYSEFKGMLGFRVQAQGLGLSGFRIPNLSTLSGSIGLMPGMLRGYDFVVWSGVVRHSAVGWLL